MTRPRPVPASAGRLAAAFAAALIAGAAAAEDRLALVTILTAPEPQTQLMAMVLTAQAQAKGAAVHVLLCGPAGDMALKAAPAAATAPQPPAGMSPQTLLRRIVANGGTAEVCAIYLPGRNEGPDALIDGVTPARPDAMADRILDGDTRLLSF